ncbi:hypothetical protein [Klebsiella pneumoniae]|uniref:hypothetical protein n=1 Tax=Klebsiella pneumoniae TaxID=573 RepID=UPI001124DDF0|nr:hypothetical protein [Klebsiella pneumoniae]
MASGTELRLCRMAAAPYPAYNPKSPLAQGLLKLPVLAASTSHRAAAMLLAGARGYRGRRRLAAPCALPAP